MGDSRPEQLVDNDVTVSSSDLYRCLFEEAADGIFVADAGGTRYLAVNQRACELTGYSSGELLGMSITQLVAPEDLERTPARLSELDNGRIVFSQRVLCRKDGSRITAEIAGRRLSDGRLLGLLRDTSQRTKLEAELRASEQRFRSLVQNSTDVIGMYAADATILYQSPAVSRVLGYEPSELIGKSLYSLIDPDQLELARAEHLALVAKPGQVIQSERGYRHRDGSLRWIEVIGSNLLDDPNVRAIVKNYRDITERKRQEVEREALRVELLHAQKMESMGRFAGGIAHDFNNMLTVILGGIESALGSLGADHPQEPRLLDARAAALRSAELTRGLLAFARKQAVRPTALDLNQSVEKTLGLLRRLVGSQIELIWAPCAAPWRALIDSSQFDQILMNLVVNARDAIERTGTIRVSTENITDSGTACAEYMRLVVSDDGMGMDAETQARAFEPYFTTKGPEGGSGIGLSTVYGIVMQSSGRLKLISTPGHGTSVLVDLPRFRERPDAPVVKRETAAASRVPATVLVVEDDPSVLRLIEMQLLALGYVVLTAGSADAALQRVATSGSAIDLVLADIFMPKMAGVGLVQALQAKHPELKFVFMSGVDSVDRSPIAPLLQRSVFLPKPFSLRQLSDAVGLALNPLITSAKDEAAVGELDSCR